MVEIDGAFLKTWREKYRWPFCKSRTASEEKIFWLEKIVVDHVLKEGSWTVKDVLLEIVDWKTGGRQVNRFCNNNGEQIESKVNEVLGILNQSRDKVSECVEIFALKDKLLGVGVPVASAFLRFLDPASHRYGIIDKNIAGFLNREGVTNFKFVNKSLASTYENNDEYERYHHWLGRKADEVRNFTFTSVYDVKTRWTPVDVEMALFAYCTQSRPLQA